MSKTKPKRFIVSKRKFGRSRVARFYVFDAARGKDVGDFETNKEAEARVAWLNKHNAGEK